MNKFYCHDCGRFFESENENENENKCVLCGRNWVEKTVQCCGCREYYLKVDLVEGLCANCRNKVKAATINKLLSTFSSKEIALIYNYLDENKYLRGLENG